MYFFGDFIAVVLVEIFEYFSEVLDVFVIEFLVHVFV